ncbi:hypothetical protein VNO78_25221 [Psophocarpus tetragonolobus]|uniref:Uncharacterized protein n=1 Tax=Psophocarpus tetragonolobus TaxID=3891 RepID=A0AAN9XFM1_PSOTE
MTKRFLYNGDVLCLRGTDSLWQVWYVGNDTKPGSSLDERKGTHRAHVLAVKAKQCYLQTKLKTQDSAIALLLLHHLCETETTEIDLYGILACCFCGSYQVICCHEVHEILETVLTAEVNSVHVFYSTLLS